MSDHDHDDRLRALEAENARLRRLLEQKGMPSALRHQVRNVLALVRAMLRRSAETSSSVEDYAAHLEGRFDALLRIQTLLIRASVAGIDLHAVLTNELVAHLIQEDEKVTLRGPPVNLAPNVAESLALAVHELVTNAVKFGAMTVADGHIDVSWSLVEREGRSVVDLEWTESGFEALPPAPPFRGFGLTALESMLPYQLGAESKVTFEPAGLRWTLKLPLGPPSHG